MFKKLLALFDKNILEISFVISAIALISSMVISNVLDFAPCNLCWYQRIFMFALPFIFGAAILYKNSKAFVYTLPLIVIGFFVALYQNLLVWGVISEDSSSCSVNSVSCVDQPIEIFGFLTIPLGSMLMFLVLGILMFRQLQLQHYKLDISKKQQEIFSKLLLFVAAVSIVGIILTALLYDK